MTQLVPSLRRFVPRVAHLLCVFVLTATLAFAQSSAFGQAAQGIATEMIAIAKWVGIILCIGCGIGIYSGGHGAVAKVSGFFIGLVFALFSRSDRQLDPVTLR